jgi:adenylate cyclase
MERPLTVSELLPPADEGTDLSDAQLAAYRQAVDCFIRGDWEDAYRALHTLPASDRAQDFLRVLIAQHNRTAPPGWDGIIKLPSK